MPPGLQEAVEMGGRDGEVQGRFDLPLLNLHGTCLKSPLKSSCEQVIWFG